MSEGVLTAVVGAVGVVAGAFLTWLSTRRSTDQTRLGVLEKRVDVLEARNAVLWRYARDLVDHIYRGDGPPPPPWPDELLEASS